MKNTKPKCIKNHFSKSNFPSAIKKLPFIEQDNKLLVGEQLPIGSRIIAISFSLIGCLICIVKSVEAKHHPKKLLKVVDSWPIVKFLGHSTKTFQQNTLMSLVFTGHFIAFQI